MGEKELDGPKTQQKSRGKKANLNGCKIKNRRAKINFL